MISVNAWMNHPGGFRLGERLGDAACQEDAQMIEGGEEGIAAGALDVDTGEGNAGKDVRRAMWERGLQFAQNFDVVAIVGLVGVLDQSPQGLDLDVSIGCLPGDTAVGADLADSDRIEVAHAAEAIQYRPKQQVM